MSSSDEGPQQYAVRPGRAPGGTPPSASMQRPQSARHWAKPPQEPAERVNVYHNELFHDGDVLGGPAEGEAQPSMHAAASPSTQRPMSAHRMMQQKSSLAARRQERMQANLYEQNETALRNVSSPHGPRPALAFSPTAARGAQTPTGSGATAGNVYGMRSTYDPNEEERMKSGGGAAAPAAYNSIPQPMPRLDLSDLRSFLHTPGPRNGPILCYIVRDKGSAKMYPKYNLFLDDGKRFLLAARKRKKQTTSNYLVSLDYDDLNRDSEKYFGKLRANFVGTEFSIYDNGAKPGQAKSGSQAGDGMRQELGCVLYQYNVLGTRGPRKMTAAIPQVDASGRRIMAPSTREDDMLERVKVNAGLEEMVVMHNKPPRWNEELNAYCLNFNGRVTEASVKNFQLVTEDNQGHVILQFGKIGKNTFTMDYQWPMSAFQAFTICLSSFDNKLACE